MLISIWQVDHQITISGATAVSTRLVTRCSALMKAAVRSGTPLLCATSHSPANDCR